MPPWTPSLQVDEGKGWAAFLRGYPPLTRYALSMKGSLMATTLMSFLFRAARSTSRPIRPKPEEKIKSECVRKVAPDCGRLIKQGVVFLQLTVDSHTHRLCLCDTHDNIST